MGKEVGQKDHSFLLRFWRESWKGSNDKNWLLSSRHNLVCVSLFLKRIQSQIGELQNSVIMWQKTHKE